MAWKLSCDRSVSCSIAPRNVGAVCERPEEAVEAAVEGRWVV